MKKVYVAQDTLLLNNLKNTLQAKGVDCVLKNADLRGGVSIRGDRPAAPELWILDDNQLLFANRLLDSMLVSELSHSEPWYCVTCGQKLENQFADCWNCGAPSDFISSLEDEEDEAEEE